MATTTTGLITTEQFLALPDQFDEHGNRIKEELIAGEIVPVAFTSSLHDLVKNRIGKSLDRFLEARTDLDLETLIEVGYAVTDQDSFKPDVCAIKMSRLRNRDSRILSGAPEIAIEVVSPTDTAIALKHKIGAYLANGSHSVWVVYPDEKSVEVHTNRGARDFTGGELIEDPTLPGFSQPVSAFFEGI